jgi:hypothetical protein
MAAPTPIGKAMSDIGTLITTVVRARELAEGADVAVVTSRAAWEKDAEALLAAQKQLRESLATAEAELRAAAVAAYDGEHKAIAPGVGIREITEYSFEAVAALTWAKSTGMCLSLDSKAFRDLCKSASNRPAFVAEMKVVTATIASDLRETQGAVK